MADEQYSGILFSSEDIHMILSIVLHVSRCLGLRLSSETRWQNGGLPQVDPWATTKVWVGYRAADGSSCPLNSARLFSYPSQTHLTQFSQLSSCAQSLKYSSTCLRLVSLRRQKIPSQRQIIFASSSLHKNPSSWSIRQKAVTLNPVALLKNHLHVNHAPLQHAFFTTGSSRSQRELSLQSCKSTWQQLLTFNRTLDTISLLAAARNSSSQVFAWQNCPQPRLEVSSHLMQM